MDRDNTPKGGCVMLFLKFVNFVVHHWVISLLSVIYVRLTMHTVAQFFFQFVAIKKNPLFGDVHYRLFNKWQMPSVLMLIVAVPTLLLLFLVAPILWFLLRRLEEAKQKEYRKKWRQEQATADRLRIQENNRRFEARREWFAANKPKLYYNTVNGITAVLRPDVYEDVRKNTERSRRNGFWEKDNILMPARQTVVFVTRQGGDLVQSVSEYTRRYKVAGWISDLDDLVDQHGVELERKEDIFVPWVNASVLSFEEQKRQLDDCDCDNYRNLVELQAPREFQSVA